MKADTKTKSNSLKLKKLKKNALEYVNFELEKQNDPKYKTELCKSWLETNFCKYANKCRFAHGKQELYQKDTIEGKYKIKPCYSYNYYGYCMYGTRCNFIHDQRRLQNIDRSYYIYNLYTYSIQKSKKSHRLEVFSKFIQARTADSSPIIHHKVIYQS